MQNNKKETIYTKENFNNLINALKNIKEKTKDSGDTYKQKIFDTLNEIEKISQYKPSYKNFINHIISQENIDKAQDNIIKNIQDKNIAGYSPELKVLIDQIINDENIKITKDYYIEEFKILNI